MDKLWEKQAVPSFFLGEPLEVMGARGGLGKRNCSVLGGRWLRSSASFRSAKAELGSCGRNCNSSAVPRTYFPASAVPLPLLS